MDDSFQQNYKSQKFRLMLYAIPSYGFLQRMRGIAEYHNYLKHHK